MPKGQDRPTEQTATTTVEPPKEARKLIELGMPFIKQFAASGGPTVPGAEAIAPFDPLQMQGQQMALDAAGNAITGIAGGARGAADFLSGDVLRPESNPYLASFIDYATQPVFENLTQRVLPAIRSGAGAAGQFGGSRQGIAEGLAAQGASRAAGGISSDIATRAYGQGLDAMLRNLQLSPQTAALQTLPATVTSGVGDVRQAMAQALLGAGTNQAWMNEVMPFLMGQSLLGLAGGIPGGTTTASSPIIYPQSNPFMGAAGGALSGASLGSSFGPFGGVAGAGLGGLLGLFGS